MKSNKKFFTIVISLLFLSSMILTGCMYAIGADNGEMKDYDLNVQKTSQDLHNNIVKEDAPTEQTELQKRFSAMCDISEDGKTITVISKEYLSELWFSNYEKEVIHSLSTEEVYFIIQDSIRIYMEYDKVILSEFSSASSNKQVAERFPSVEEQEICRPEISRLNRDTITADIHKIIMYRLRALSSPKTFFTGADAIRFVGGEPVACDSLYPESVFYIPGYSADTDRDYILSIMGGSSNFTDLERFTDLFEVSTQGSMGIRFSSIANGTTTEVFPNDGVYIQGYIAISGSMPSFNLYYDTGSFWLNAHIGTSFALKGKFDEHDGILKLYAEDGTYSYVFHQTDHGYVYSAADSKPFEQKGFDWQEDLEFVKVNMYLTMDPEPWEGGSDLWQKYMPWKIDE